MNFYLDGERGGSFIVDAKASYIHGQPYNGHQAVQAESDELRVRSNVTSSHRNDEVLQVKIIHSDTGVAIIDRAGIAFNETGREYSITLTSFKPSQAPSPIKLELTKRDGTIFTATTDLYFLPNPAIPQTVSRIDSLRGSLQLRSNGPSFETVFPYSFYLSGAWLASDATNLRKFKDLGYNVLHVVPGGDGIGYDLNQLDAWYDEAEKLGLWIMHDMRWTYQNRDYVRIQVERYKRRKNMLLWYTADEPDGHEDSPDAPSKAYSFIKSLDPYHPISLCLNCQNYHFQEYSAGADIIMADIYPIGTNTEYSTKYNTPCNTTYGDCGCDNCRTSPTSPALLNIPSRLDLWSRFQSQLGLAPKPIWSVPQAFPAQDFWTRTPTPEEVFAMTLLSINHGATGIVMWNFPTADEIVEGTSKFSAVIMGREFGHFVPRARPEACRVIGEGKVEGSVDASAWRVGGEMLVSVVGVEARGVWGLILPGGARAKEVRTRLWGRDEWKVRLGGSLASGGMEGVESFALVVEIEDEDW
ncbi:MAG: hypothetical protein Q9208_006404 [Pyrenodesmia sp. 3 TL-2023]